jgi:hypothetical protein
MKTSQSSFRKTEVSVDGKLINSSTDFSVPPGLLNKDSDFDEKGTLEVLKKYLPAQAPLKDFIFQNSLEAFQHLPFFEGLKTASEIFGYNVFLPLSDFRKMYAQGKIKETILNKILFDAKGRSADRWKEKLLLKDYENTNTARIGVLRANWKNLYKIDLDSLVHPILFRIICSYLDQGISIWNFPVLKKGFLDSIKDIERNSFTSFFRKGRAKQLLLKGNTELKDLLTILVGDASMYDRYLFDQQFAHQGWSGMVSVIETSPETLIDQKKITLKEFITLELLLEIDALDMQFGEGNWSPLADRVMIKPPPLFAPVGRTELDEILSIWQEALEWSHYDEVIKGLQLLNNQTKEVNNKSFHALFCIDDRECSFRRHIENADSNCETFGTPGFFNVEFFFQPENGRYYTKLCPAPTTPKYLIRELGKSGKRKSDAYFTKQTHSLLGGFLISQTLGFWSAFKLIGNLFKPSMSPSVASSFNHMNKASKLTILNKHLSDRENNLQVGFTIEEMADRIETLLRSIGLIKNFAPIVYVIGHGASSVNNPFYTTMDCGACSCRPGSVNARVCCYMANHLEVRLRLKERGIDIPADTQFVGGLHDTTSDELVFFDEDALSIINSEAHNKNIEVFAKACCNNAKERSRRFESIDTKLSAEKIHAKIKKRGFSIFEPRPELDHANNSLTIIGRRNLTKGLFLDRRAFMNSYDYNTDLKGEYLKHIMDPIAPVCGGINLSYYFSRVDNQKLGAGSKLPHNVMGLFGVANGADGDLRPGLPRQMIETHDPLRQLILVEHYPEIVLEIVRQLSNYDWYKNYWMHLIAIHPESKEIVVFKNEQFVPYKPITESIPKVEDIMTIIENSGSQENIPVYLISV